MGPILFQENQSVFLEDRYLEKTLTLTPNDGSGSVWQILPNGGLGVITQSTTEAIRTLTYSVFDVSGEIVGSPIVLASVPKDSGYLRGDFVVGSTGDVSIQYSVVTGTSYFHSHKVPAGDRVEH